MLKNRNTPLPLHHGGGIGNGGGINAALDKGLNLVGLAATKTGSGEKERAYVVKQNSVLKGLLCVVMLATIVLIVVFSTVLELKIARRGLIISEVAHHKKEHHDHEEIVKTSLELQEALEATIEETTLVEEFRAFFEKAVGQADDTIDKLFEDAKVPKAIMERAKALQRDFVKNVEIKLGRIINRFQARAAEARQKVIKLAKMMGKEIDDDAKDSQKYGERLHDLGVDEDYAEKIEEQYEEDQDDDDDAINEDDLTEEEKQMSPEEVREKRQKEAKEQEQEAEKEVEEQLESFFAKLRKLNLPEVPSEKIELLEKTLADITNVMKDETKDTDLEMLAKKMESSLMQHAPGAYTEKYDPKKHDSLVDFFSGIIERAKLYPHRQTLIDMYNGWKSPGSSLTAMSVLGAIENVAFKEHLMKIFDLLEGNDIDPHTETKTEHESEGAGGGNAAQDGEKQVGDVGSEGSAAA